MAGEKNFIKINYVEGNLLLLIIIANLLAAS